MPLVVRYLTHPQVIVDPLKDMRRWSLNATGAARVSALAAQPGRLSGTRRVISSDEAKALETAGPVALALGVDVEIRPGMGENDRSATGFLPPAEFERVADEFFARPFDSIRGWETATDAQRRILSEVDDCLAGPQDGDVLLVGHGGVGTLLFCALSGVGIDRRFDQGPGGGGCWFQFGLGDRKPRHGWKQMERLREGD